MYPLTDSHSRKTSLIIFTFFEGECYISYYEKKKKNKDYVAGSNNINIDDMFLWLGPEYKDIFYVVVRVFTIASYISIYIVLKRNGYPNYIIYSYIFMLFLYYVYLRIPNISSLYHNFLKVYLIGLKVYLIGLIIYMGTKVPPYPLLSNNDHSFQSQ